MAINPLHDAITQVETCHKTWVGFIDKDRYFCECMLLRGEECVTFCLYIGHSHQQAPKIREACDIAKKSSSSLE